jgi:hypothetical protein
MVLSLPAYLAYMKTIDMTYQPVEGAKPKLPYSRTGCTKCSHVCDCK